MEENTARNLTTETPLRMVDRTLLRPSSYSEIDLMDLLLAVRHRFYIVLFCGIMGALIAALATQFLISPKYTSTSKMLVLTKETTISSLADLQIGSQLTNDYTILIQSRPVLQKVSENLMLGENYESLRDRLSISNPNQSRILEISITDKSPQAAKRVVDELSAVAADYISEKMEVTRPNIIEDGEIPPTQSSPSMSHNVVVGLLIGMCLSIAFICLSVVMNDSIIDEDDVEKFLGLSTLAVVPDKENTGSSRKAEKKKTRKANKKSLKGGRRI